MFRQRRRFRSSKAADEGKAVPKTIPVLFLAPFSLLAYANFLDIPTSTTMMSNELHLSYQLYCLQRSRFGEHWRYYPLSGLAWDVRNEVGQDIT
jgi:hypothetical protein